jgi:hypothetical protein
LLPLQLYLSVVAEKWQCEAACAGAAVSSAAAPAAMTPSAAALLSLFENPTMTSLDAASAAKTRNDLQKAKFRDLVTHRKLARTVG